MLVILEPAAIVSVSIPVSESIYVLIGVEGSVAWSVA